MAIKFSQFVVKTSSSDLSHIVGYNGVDNIQITPTNFLNTALTGTAGQVLFYDTTGVTGDNDLYWNNTNKQLGIGTTSPAAKLDVNIDDDGITDLNALILKRTWTNPGTNDRAHGILFSDLNSSMATIYADRTNSATNFNSDLLFATNTGTNGTNVSTKMIIKNTGNVGIGTTSPTEKLQVDGNIKVGDSQQFVAGDGNDLQISHNGNNTDINNFTGNLNIVNAADDADIIFYADNGSGGNAEYFRLDGSATLINVSAPNGMQFNDNIRIKVGSGSGGDLRLFHNANDSIIQNTTGDLYIENTADNKDIIFLTDNGSGGTVPYMTVDGANEVTSFQKSTKHEDSVVANFGNASDLTILHDSNHSYIKNYTGDLYIENFGDDSDIIFKSDNGSGGVATYFFLDGSATQTTFQLDTRYNDSVKAKFGNSNDLQIYHEGTDSIIQNYTGSIYVDNNADDQDIIFRCDDGSGGLETYFYLDGSAGRNVSNKNFRIIDSKKLSLGSSDDLQIQHSSGTNIIDSTIGDLIIKVSQDDGDMIFQGDNGSGAIATYFRLDGGDVRTEFEEEARFLDSVEARFGTSGDLRVYHDGTTSHITNSTGNLNILNSADDGDILFRCDDGSGGNATYFFLDGSKADGTGNLYTNFPDKSHLTFGDSDDLQIYHNGSNSYIEDTGTGDFYLQTNGTNIFLRNGVSGNSFIAMNTGNDDVSLRYGGSEKLSTTSTGIKVTGVSEYADNAAAIAGGLTTGDVYRTGDLLKIVH